MLINKSLPSLIGGVSEQPQNLRHPTQVTSMVNCVPAIATGKSKRAGSTIISDLVHVEDGDMSDAYVFGIDRGTDESERYFVVVSNAGIKVFDWDGQEQTVNTPDGLGYLGATVPRTSFDHVTVADYTIITNKLVGAASANLASATITPTLYVIVKVGVVDTDYKITLDGVTYTAPIGNTAGANKTDTIAEALLTLINAGATHTAVRTENLLVITKDAGGAFTWSVSDSYGDAALFGFRDTVQRFEELPRKFIEDVTIKVIGAPEAPNDGWYVKWEKSDANSDGLWVETRAHNIYTDLEPTSMPHKLVRNLDATWTFAAIEWEPREVGDDDSAPMPSFVGHRIEKVFFFRNRLGFLSDENIILSQVDDYFNFFPDSARAVLDSDPIDVSGGSTSSKINFMRQCLAFDKALFVSSDGRQFQFGGQEILSPKTARLAPTTAFEISACNPVAVGSNVLFASKKGSYTAVREYYFDPDSTGNDALDVTSHVPTFIPGDAFQMSAVPALDQLFILTETIRSEASVYTTFWNGQEKVQSAWHRWYFGGSPTIVSLMPFNTTLCAALQYPEGLFLVRVELDGRSITDAPLLWPIRLDRMYTTDLGDHSGTGVGHTTWPIAYNYTTAMQAVVLTKTGEVGQVLDLEQVSTVDVRAVGNYEGETVVIGEKFPSSTQLSQFFVRDKDGRPILDSKLQLRDLSLEFTGTGYFEVLVFPAGRDSFTYPYTGRVLGVLGVQLGTRRMQDGEFRAPLMAKSDECNVTIFSDQALPFNIQAGQFSGHFAQLSRRA
jgi:hypothetical protein